MIDVKITQQHIVEKTVAQATFLVIKALLRHLLELDNILRNITGKRLGGRERDESSVESETIFVEKIL